tara:strand:+ start:1975 stop:3684 length:1710 start_codon:yes stop_codon:yes gene_type:complete
MEGEYFRLNLHQRDPLSRIRNVSTLKKLIRKWKIDVVHAHSRASSWACHHACARTKAAFVSTVHGRQHIHRSSVGKQIYGSLTAVVCENLKTHLHEELKLPSGTIEVIPNPFEVSTGPRAVDSDSKTLSIGLVGRASGPKGLRCTEFLNEVVPVLESLSPQPVQILLAGFEWDQASKDLQNAILRWKGNSKIEMKCLGFLKDVSTLWPQIDVLVGAGRTLVEGLLHRVPGVALGESSYEGPVKFENFDQVLRSNFGDISKSSVPFQWDPKIVAKDLIEQGALHELSPLMHEKVCEWFDEASVASKIDRLYQRALGKKAHSLPIPALMYHRVVEPGFHSKHKTYVFEKELRRQFEWLKRKGFTTLTYKDLWNFESGKRSWEEFPKRPIFLSFDDGYKNNHQYLLPLLKEFGFKITLFVLAGGQLNDNSWDLKNDPQEPRHELMSLEEIKDFVKAGSEIGSHGLSHSNFTEIPKEEVFKELVSSKEILEKELGLEILSFAYPFGKFTDETEELTKKAGYRYGISTDSGGIHWADNPYAIFRANVFPEDLGLKFQKKTSPGYRLRFWKTRGR